jgi:16S rRNA (adenine1518-N6/adenine1519-N6)-dimethyltransferase
MHAKRSSRLKHSVSPSVRPTLAKKSLGQNFLMHQQTADRIADVAEVAGKTVLEIGPGTGMLTRALLARALRVIAVEADADLIPLLAEEFGSAIQEGRLVLIHADIRTFDSLSIGESYVLAANIPYYITGEIIRQFLTATHKPSSMTLLVQKEVAVRIAREKKESLLSLSVKAFGTPVYEFTVPRGAFKPAPNVDSAVLSIRNIKPRAFLSKSAEDRFFSILRAGFAHKRKLLRKNLELVATPEAIESAFSTIPLPEKVRAEELSLTEWQNVALALS